MAIVQVGIIGAGRIGRLHAENLMRMAGIHVKVISDLYPDQAEEWAKSIGVPHVTDKYEHILQDPDIAAVLICSSTDAHASQIKEAAQAGKAVFCEKPVSLDWRQTKEAIAAAEDAGVILQIGFNRRFDPNFRTVREWVAEGKIGAVHMIKITSRDPSPPPPSYIRSSGGLFLDMTIHDFDMARYLSGSDITEVHATGGVLVDPQIGEAGDIDTALITMKFANGAFGVIDNSRKAVYGYDQRVEVFGSDGCVTADNDFPSNAQLLNAGGVHREKPLYFFLERYKTAYERELHDFIRAVKGDIAVRVTGNDALQAELAAHAALQSLREGRPVQLSRILEEERSATV